MPKFVSFVTWSSASWARMIENADDRIAEVRRVLKAFGGTVESVYWMPLATHDALLIADVPDTITAAAVTFAVTSAGAEHSIQTFELFTEAQLRDALTLAAEAKRIYRPPGYHEQGQLLGRGDVPRLVQDRPAAGHSVAAYPKVAQVGRLRFWALARNPADSDEARPHAWP